MNLNLTSKMRSAFERFLEQTQKSVRGEIHCDFIQLDPDSFGAFRLIVIMEMPDDYLQDIVNGVGFKFDGPSNCPNCP